MASITDLIPPEIREHKVYSSGMWFGLVIPPIPAEISDDLYVTIPDIDINMKWGPCRWNPRVLTLPVEGSEALVLFDNRQNPWVVAVWP